MDSFQHGCLMPIGGAEDKSGQQTILRRFVQMCGGADAAIAVIPTASAFAGEVGDSYCQLFRQIGAARVECLHVRERAQANSRELAAVLEQVDGVFISGGDQLKLASLLAGTRFAATLQQRLACGVHIAGTSAGASAMSRQMIAFGHSGMQPSQRMVQLASGLGLTDWLIIDQHFTQRARLGRLTTAVALNPGMIGIGVDEDTALILAPNGDCEVIGSGTVTVVDGRDLQFTDIYAVKRHAPIRVQGIGTQVFASGAKFHLDQPLYGSYREATSA
jgi:cyanophycinase